MAGRVVHETEEQRRQLAEYLALWGLVADPDGFDRGRRWMEQHGRESSHASFWVNVTKGDYSGASILFVSSMASMKRRRQEYGDVNGDDLLQPEPYWYEFRVFVYPGLQVMNFHGLTRGIGDRTSADHGRPLGVVHQFFDSYLSVEWRSLYGRPFEGVAGLRKAIYECLGSVHVELFHCLSMLKYFGLDLYVRYVSGGEVDEEEAVTKFVQNCSLPVYQRKVPAAGYWWYYPDLESVGQCVIVVDPRTGIVLEVECSEDDSVWGGSAA